MSGEVCGSLDKSLVYLADQLEKDYELKGKVKSAMTYPIFVFVALVGIALLMFKFVLPNLTSVLDRAGRHLPPVTVAIIAFSNFFNVFWWLCFIVVAALILGVTVLY